MSTHEERMRRQLELKSELERAQKEAEARRRYYQQLRLPPRKFKEQFEEPVDEGPGGLFGPQGFQSPIATSPAAAPAALPPLMPPTGAPPAPPPNPLVRPLDERSKPPALDEQQRGLLNKNIDRALARYRYGTKPQYAELLAELNKGALSGLFAAPNGDVFRKYRDREGAVRVEEVPLYNIDWEARKARRYNYRDYNRPTKDGRDVTEDYDQDWLTENFDVIARKNPFELSALGGVSAGAANVFSKPIYALHGLFDDEDEISSQPQWTRTNTTFGQDAGNVLGALGAGLAAGYAALPLGLAAAGAAGAATPVLLEESYEVGSGRDTPLAGLGKVGASAAMGAAGGALTGRLLQSQLGKLGFLGADALAQSATGSADALLHGGIDALQGKDIDAGDLARQALVTGGVGALLGTIGNIPGKAPKQLNAARVAGYLPPAIADAGGGPAGADMRGALEEAAWNPDAGDHGDLRDFAKPFFIETKTESGLPRLELKANAETRINEIYGAITGEPAFKKTPQEIAGVLNEVLGMGTPIRRVEETLRTPTHDLFVSENIKLPDHLAAVADAEFNSLIRPLAKKAGEGDYAKGLERLAENLGIEAEGLTLDQIGKRLKSKWEGDSSERFVKAASSDPVSKSQELKALPEAEKQRLEARHEANQKLQKDLRSQADEGARKQAAAARAIEIDEFLKRLRAARMRQAAELNRARQIVTATRQARDAARARRTAAIKARPAEPGTPAAEVPPPSREAAASAPLGSEARRIIKGYKTAGLEGGKQNIAKMAALEGGIKLNELVSTGRVKGPRMPQPVTRLLKDLGINYPRSGSGTLSLKDETVGSIRRSKSEAGKAETEVKLLPEFLIRSARQEAGTGALAQSRIRLKASDLETPAVKAELKRAGFDADQLGLLNEGGSAQAEASRAVLTLKGEEAHLTFHSPEQLAKLNEQRLLEAEDEAAGSLHEQAVRDVERDLNLDAGRARYSGVGTAEARGVEFAVESIRSGEHAQRRADNPGSHSHKAIKKLRSAFPGRELDGGNQYEIFLKDTTPAEAREALKEAGLLSAKLERQLDEQAELGEGRQTAIYLNAGNGTLYSSPVATSAGALLSAGAVDENDDDVLGMGLSGKWLKNALLGAAGAAALGGGVMLFRGKGGRFAGHSRSRDYNPPDAAAPRLRKVPALREVNMFQAAAKLSEKTGQSIKDVIRESRKIYDESQRGLIEHSRGSLAGYLADLTNLARENPWAKRIADAYNFAERKRGGVVTEIKPLVKAWQRLSRAERNQLGYAGFVVDQLTTAATKNRNLTLSARSAIVDYAVSPATLKRLLGGRPLGDEPLRISRWDINSVADVDRILGELKLKPHKLNPDKLYRAYTDVVRPLQNKLTAYDLTAYAEKKTGIMEEDIRAEMPKLRAELARLETEIKRYETTGLPPGKDEAVWRAELQSLSGERDRVKNAISHWEGLPDLIRDSEARHYLSRWHSVRDGDFYLRVKVTKDDGRKIDLRFFGKSSSEVEKRLTKEVKRYGLERYIDQEQFEAAVTNTDYSGDKSAYIRYGEMSTDNWQTGADRLRTLLFKLKQNGNDVRDFGEGARSVGEEIKDWLHKYGENEVFDEEADAARNLLNVMERAKAAGRPSGLDGVRTGGLLGRDLANAVEMLVNPPARRILHRQDTKGYEVPYPRMHEWMEEAVTYQLGKGYHTSKTTRGLKEMDEQLKELKDRGLDAGEYYGYVDRLRLDALNGRDFIFPSAKALDRKLNYLSAYYSAGVLGMNALSAAKNVVGGSISGLMGVADYWFNPLAAFRKAGEIPAIVKELYGKGILPETSVQHYRTAPGLGRRTTSILYAPTRYAEMLNRGLWGSLKAMDSLRKGLTMDEAIADAHEFVNLTQGKFEPEFKTRLERDISRLPGGDAVQRLFGPFVRFVNFQARVMRQSLNFRNPEQKQRAAAALAALGFGVIGAGIESVPFASDALMVLESIHDGTSGESGMAGANFEERLRIGLREFARARGLSEEQAESVFTTLKYGALTTLTEKKYGMDGKITGLAQPLVITQTFKDAQNLNKFFSGKWGEWATDQVRRKFPQGYHTWRIIDQLRAGKRLDTKGNFIGEGYTVWDGIADFLGKTDLSFYTAKEGQYGDVVPLSSPQQREQLAKRLSGIAGGIGGLTYRDEAHKARTLNRIFKPDAGIDHTRLLRDAVYTGFREEAPNLPENRQQLTFSGAKDRSQAMAEKFITNAEALMGSIINRGRALSEDDVRLERTKSKLVSDTQKFYVNFAAAYTLAHSLQDPSIDFAWRRREFTLGKGKARRTMDRVSDYPFHEMGFAYSLHRFLEKQHKDGALTQQQFSSVVQKMRSVLGR